MSLVVREDGPIFVATNFGEGSRIGLERAIDVAHTRGREVIALHVFTPSLTSPSASARTRRAMERWLAPVARRDRVLRRIEPGDPERVLVTATVGASCLVLGASSWLGTAARIATRVRCPVHFARG